MQKFSFVLLLFVFFTSSAQSFLINFPIFTSAPFANPRNLTICNGTSQLKVRLSVAQASTTGADVSINLGPGVEYVPGSVSIVSSNATLTIIENGGTANVPVFKIGPSALAVGNEITFTIERKATCPSRLAVIVGTTFKDTVSASIDGGTPTVAESGSYTISYPVFGFTQPVLQANAEINTAYNRTFSLTNGGNGSANAVHFSIDYPAGGIVQNSLTLTGGSGSTGTPLTLTPTSTSGTTRYYTITSANLSGGTFDNGEGLTFSENYTVKSCTGVTNYNFGWGCDSTPASWCQTVTGIGSISATLGAASLTTFTVAKVGYVNDCLPYNYTFTYKNAGTGTTKTAAMYNAVFRVGGGVNTMGDVTGTFDTSNSLFVLNTLTYNGNSLPITTASPNAHLRIDLKNHFTTDPDGTGAGLEDLDGDGYYDDLLPGSTITFTLNVNRSNNLSCNQSWSRFWNFKGDIVYDDMCSTSKTTSLVWDSNRSASDYSLTRTYMGEVLTQADNSYAPSNIYDGVPFRMRFAETWYAMGTINYNPNQRYEWVVTLPVGVNISGTGNIKWVNGKDVNSTTILTPTYTYNATTRELTVLSPGVEMGMFFIDLVFDCATGTGGAVPITYKTNYINDYTTNCRVSPNLYCGTYTLANVICPAPCVMDGPQMTYVKMEREDDSLDWTNSSMTTHQTRANIDDYNLAKALYLDNFFIKANSIQQVSAADNLYVKLIIDKKGSATAYDLIQAKTIDVVIKRGGTTVASGTLGTSVLSTTGSSSTQQVVIWNATSLLPSGGLLVGDVIETISHYSVIQDFPYLPQRDMQTGNTFYMYNLVNGADHHCSGLVPEMYLSGTDYLYSSGAVSAIEGCTLTALQISGYRNFSVNGIKFKNEFRPGFKPTALEVFIPTSLTFVNISSNGNLYLSGNVTTPTSITPATGGNIYRFDFTSTPAQEIDLYVTTGAGFTLRFTPSCAATGTSTIRYRFSGPDYYYHYADLATNPYDVYTAYDNSATNQFAVGVPFSTATKPSITVANQTGSIQASKPTESFTIRVSSNGGSTAPYIWFNVPTQTGVTVTQVVDLTSGAVATPIAHSGGNWFKISSAGLAPGTFRDFRLDFKYTVCTASTVNVTAGWDCAGYPTSPAGYVCTPLSLSLPFTPLPGEVQLGAVTQPSTPITGLCSPLAFQYEVNSAGAGNLTDVKLAINLATGTTLVTSSIQVEYPKGANNWASVAYTTSGNTVLLDLTTHPNYNNTNGLPGTLNDGGNANNRAIEVRFNITTDCTFVSGSNFTLSPYAKNTCGADTTGNGATLASNSLTIQGADPAYLVSSEISINPVGTFDNCNAPLAVPFKQTIVSSNPTGSTGTTRVDLPLGYDFSSSPLACTGTFCPVVQGVYTDAVTGKRYIILSVPSGMVSGDEINYTLTVVKSGAITCGTNQILVRNFDKAGSIACATAPGGQCTDVVIQTGTYVYNFTVNNPVLDITSISGNFSGGNLVGSITIANTSSINQTNAAPTNPVKIDFYCADSNGVSNGVLLGTATLLSTFNAGTTITEAYSIPATMCSTGVKVVAVLSPITNCVCTGESESFNLACYKPAATSGTVLSTNHGVTSLGRAGADNGNWPMVRKGAWTVLEAKTKGFVVNRLTDLQIAAIPSANLVAGMMVYNVTQHCLMINTNGTAAGWKCYVTPACPD